MSSVYIHVPFCKQRCSYCDFFSCTDYSQIDDFVYALVNEIEAQKYYLTNKNLQTIYFGGGTPSLLGIKELEYIWAQLHQYFTSSPDTEVTIEVNPDDLSYEYLTQLRQLGFNRVSMGIQSFNDKELALLNRRHNASEALRALEWVDQAGFSNVSIDLIYGIPGQTKANWHHSLKKALQLHVPHISAYHLTYEKGTALEKQRLARIIKPITEEESVDFYETLTQQLKEAQYRHYEISNFARNGLYSRHNCNYWTFNEYLGLGPSAHSFNGKERRWNKYNLKTYLAAAKTQDFPHSIEPLSETDKYNDYLITRLRTKMGIDFDDMASKISPQAVEQFHASIPQHDFPHNWYVYDSNHFHLTQKGFLFADYVMEQLIDL